MRKLAIGAAVSGALALTGLAAPVASADSPNLKFGDVVVNSGKPIVVGTKTKVTVPVTYKLTRPADLVIDYENNFLGIIAYRGRLLEPDNALEPTTKAPVCTPVVDTDITVIESCTTTLSVRPRSQLFSGSDATTWKIGAFYGHGAIDVDDSDDHVSFETGYDLWGGLGTTKLQRTAKLTVNASPEPVTKGKTLTVKGQLTRANWSTRAYSGYQGQAVTLQFKAKGATAYTDVKTVTSGTAGTLSTTVKASEDGSFRFKFAGTSSTAAKTSVGDFVDVK
jgi:hypothetical protein